MESQRFLAEFGHIANAPGGIGKLRELILSLAFKGELCPPSDEASNTLLNDIERQRLDFNSETRKQRLTRQGNTTANSVGPYEIPKHWIWVSLSTVGHTWGQKKPDDSFVYIDVSSIDNKAGVLSQSLEVISPSAAPIRARKIVKKGTLIYSTVRPYLLNIAIIDRDFDLEPIASTAFAIVHPWQGISGRYLYFYLRSPIFVRYVESVQIGMAYPAISDEKFYSGVVPLPPTEEQSRIVAKVDELMALCDTLEAKQQARRELQNKLRQSTLQAVANATNPQDLQVSWTRLNSSFHQLFSSPKDIGALRTLILELAVQGLLTEQKDTDVPAELNVAEIRRLSPAITETGRRKKSVIYRSVEDGELGYQLPKGWTFARCGELVRVLNGRAYSKPELLDKGTPVLRVGNLFTSKDWYYSNLELEADKYCDEGDLLYAWSASFGPFIWAGPRVIFHYHIWKLDLFSGEHLSKDFLYLVLQERTEAIKSSGHGISMAHMTKEKMEQLPIAVPPLDEQHRIVARVSELMRFCEEIERQLGESEKVAERFAASAIAAVTGIAIEQEEEPMKAPQTELVALLRLGTAPDIKAQAPLATILARQNGEMSAKDLWQRFGGEIDAFYAQLKTEVAHGWILEPAPAEMREKPADAVSA